MRGWRPVFLCCGVLVAAACGGRSTHDPEGEGAGGSIAGSVTGGVTGGRATGGEATGGTGDVGGAACTQPPVPGHCDEADDGFRHDPSLGLCVPYLFDACDGSENRYATREACLAACRGGAPELDACASDLDCVITSIGCCDACEPVPDSALVAVAADQIDELRALTGCTDVACAGCLAPTRGERTRHNYYPVCVDGQCTVRDVRSQPIAACDTVDDCRLRCGTGCCDACGPAEDVIAVRADADLSAEFCDGDPVPCDPCLCAVPDSYVLRCVGGFCRADFVPLCEYGVDASCNEDEASSLLAGTCNEDGTCTCHVDAGFELDPVTHRCQSAEAR